MTERYISVLADELKQGTACPSLYYDVRSRFFISGDTEYEGKMNHKLLAEFFTHLDASKTSRAALQRLLHTCEGAALFQPAVELLRDGMRARLWGIVCPTCDATAAPKWTQQERRPHEGYMQCTHTREQRDMSVTHASWSALDTRIHVVERLLPDVASRPRKSGRFAPLEQNQ